MSPRVLTASTIVAMVAAGMLSLSSAPVAAQAAASTQKPAAPKAAWTPPRTPWGEPDLQGVWDYRTITPLERPSELAGKQFLTDAEAANFESAENRRQNRDLIDPEKGGLQYPAGGVVPYNEFWYDRGNNLIGSKRTSLIVDPPDGRLPPLTPEGQKRAAASAQDARETQAGRPRADSYEDRPLSERCIVVGGVPMLPGAYNNNVQLVQSPGYVAIINEMIHDHRIVPLDGRPHVNGEIRQWLGDSRGHWEGNTLVVDTRNFSAKTDFRGASVGLHVVERFTRVDADTLDYTFTVDDPATWTRSWTATIPMKKNPDPIFEYACHEGNESIVGILTGARADEKARGR